MRLRISSVLGAGVPSSASRRRCRLRSARIRFWTAPRLKFGGKATSSNCPPGVSTWKIRPRCSSRESRRAGTLRLRAGRSFGDSSVSPQPDLGDGGPGLILPRRGGGSAGAHITVAYPCRRPKICRDSLARHRGCPSQLRPLAPPCTRRRRVWPPRPTTVAVCTGLGTGPSKGRSRHRDRSGRLPLRPRGDMGIGQQTACLKGERRDGEA